MTSMVRPGGALASRPLHFFWIIDCSGSMQGTKIGTVNNAINETLPDMRKSAAENPNAQLLIRVMKFSDDAQWITPNAVEVENFSWTDLEADGGMTNMGEVFELLTRELTMPPMPQRALPPVIVMLSDGQATDSYRKPLEKLLSMPWGKKSVRIAIAIGHDADFDALKKFTGNSELVIEVDNAPKLVKAIKWASTIAASVSAPASVQPSTQSAGTSIVTTDPPPNVTPVAILPPLPDDDEDPNEADINADDVF